MSGRVRNVCFHGIGAPSRSIDADEAGYWITTDAYLRILDELATWPTTFLSFDDGNASDIETGLPALTERGLTATFFVLAGRLGTPGSLTTDDVAALRSAGMLIGSHGMDHVSWRGMTDHVRHRELVEAREIIESVAGEITDAALPRGQYDRRTLAALRSLGYGAVHTSDRRLAREGAWLQPRFSVTHVDTPETMARAVLKTPPVVDRARLELKGVLKRWR